MPMLDDNFNKYPCCHSFKGLDMYRFILLEKEPMTESVVFVNNLYKICWLFTCKCISYLKCAHQGCT